MEKVPEQYQHDLHRFMHQITVEMGEEYKRIHSKAAEDPGTAGDEGEENWAALLRDWLPPNYHVATKGRLIGSNGTMSPQIDIVVLKPSYPRKLREKRTWLAGGVVAAFECKNTLTAQHVRDSVKRAKLFKSLVAPTRSTPFDDLIPGPFFGLLAHSHVWKGKRSKPMDTIQAAYDEAAAENEHPIDLLDAICVADLETWTQSIMAQYVWDWAPNSKALKEAYGGSWGPASAFCRSSYGLQNPDGIRPIGTLLAFVTERLAKRDEAVRDMATYFTQVRLGSFGGGKLRFWPSSVYSEYVKKEIDNGRVVDGRNNGSPWHPWSAKVG